MQCYYLSNVDVVIVLRSCCCCCVIVVLYRKVLYVSKVLTYKARRIAWLESHAHALRRVHIHTLTVCMHMWCPTSLLQIVINPTAVSGCGRTGCRNSAG
jgi:hypothetical protein